MEKITFTSGEETLPFYILDEAVLAGTTYLLVSEEEPQEEGTEPVETTVYSLRDCTPADEEEKVYEFAEDEEELSAVAALFRDTLEELGFSLEE